MHIIIYARFQTRVCLSACEKIRRPISHMQRAVARARNPRTCLEDWRKATRRFLLSKSLKKANI